MSVAVDNRRIVVLCTHPDAEGARALAGELVRARLAACVNILPGVQSVYLWQGAEEVSEELILVIKTREERYPALERILLERHPYELPEIIATPITQGLAGYLGWIDESTHA